MIHCEHRGQISDRSVQNFRRKSRRKKIKKPPCKTYTLAAATLRYADAAGSIITRIWLAVVTAKPMYITVFAVWLSIHEPNGCSYTAEWRTCSVYDYRSLLKLLCNATARPAAQQAESRLKCDHDSSWCMMHANSTTTTWIDEGYKMFS